MLVNNVKGVLFKAAGVAVGGIVSIFVGGKVEDILNDKFNPELAEAKKEYEQSVKDLAANVVLTAMTPKEDVDETESQ